MGTLQALTVRIVADSGGAAYGASVHRQVCRERGQTVSPQLVHAALKSLVQQGHLASSAPWSSGGARRYAEHAGGLAGLHR